jgi:hypothetical protein
VPNHESNNVVIIGAPANVRLFIEMAFVEPGETYPDAPEETNTRDIPLLNFDLIVPEPANIEKGGCNGQHEEGVICWYAWHLENWGTKWGAYEHSHFQLRFIDSGNPAEGIYARLDLRFETAWSQPTPIFEAIERRWNVKVHAVTQDEGGFPDVEYGDPYGEDLIRKVTTFEFDEWRTEVAESEVQG